MVFFQMVLLAGYAYTHNVSTRLNLRQQLMARILQRNSQLAMELALRRIGLPSALVNQ